MNRIDFMKQLESLLQNISPSEREEALQYYNEYFNDAGAENEQDVIEALGNPAKVAENIKKDLYGSGYGDTSYQRTSVNNRAVVEYQQGAQSNGRSGYEQAAGNGQRGKGLSGMSTGMIVLIVLLCVLASPMILSVGAGILSAVAGIICTWFALILTFGLIAVSFLVVLLVLFVVGIMCVFTDPLAGVALMGTGMIFGGLGILFLMLTVAMAGIATPAICKGIVGLFRKITGKKQAA